MKVGQHKVQSNMDLLGWKEVTTSKQKKNGTRIFELPIKKYNQKILVGSFKSGYVRRMNGCYTPYQLNKCEPVKHYWPERKWCDITKTAIKTGKYDMYIGKKRILIPSETDRIEHLVAYCLKNYYISQANEVENGDFVPKWKHEYEMKNGKMGLVRELQVENRRLKLDNSDLEREMNDICEQHATKYERYTWSGGQVTDNETGEIYVHEQHAYWNKLPSSVSVIVDGHRYPVLVDGKKY